MLRNFQVRTEPKENPGAWDSTIVSIFEDDVMLGSYERNYYGYSETTFCPFCLSDRWYALYSRDYSATRVMSLPDCRDLGGEEPHTAGFCPVEYYVPRFRPYAEIEISSGKAIQRRHFDNQPDPKPSRGDFGAWEFMSTGFVAGCIWGDDFRWKLELFDLSRAAEGLIKREARFGHVEIPYCMALKVALDFRMMTYADRPIERVRIVREEERDLKTGRLIDPYE